jgi:hypothetical protein
MSEGEGVRRRPRQCAKDGGRRTAREASAAAAEGRMGQGASGTNRGPQPS